MKRISRRFQGTVATLAIAAALGFGASQALATPREAEAAACDPVICDKGCKNIGGIRGFCYNDQCLCLLQPIP
jgi:hypothetical protein